MAKRIILISEWRHGKACPVGQLVIDASQFSSPIDIALSDIANGDDGCIADLMQYAESSTLPEGYEFGGGDVYELLPPSECAAIV